MGNDEDYEQGVRDGQRGGALDDFCKGLASSGSAYDKGYDYGADHRYNSHGEKYHTYSNDGANDPKPESSSDNSSSWGWFSSKSDDKSDNSSASENNTSSSESYSGGSDWSGGSGGSCSSSGSKSNTDTGIGGLVGLLGAIVIGGMICFNIFGKNSNSPPPKTKFSYSAQQGTSDNLNLEQNVMRLSNYLQENNQLSGNFKDYILVRAPAVIRDANKTNIGNQDYEIAFVGPNSLYVFHSSDGGMIWGPMPPRDPFILKLSENYSRGIRSGDLVREVERSMNPPRDIKVRVSLPQYDWGTSGLTPSLYRNEKAELKWSLEEKLKGNPEHKEILESLAEAIHRQVNSCQTTIYDYSKKDDDIWAVGDYSTSHKWASGKEYRDANEEDKIGRARGFICHSSDNGKTWVRQWFSENKGSEPVYKIYFSDSNEGWAHTLKRILHTNNKGLSWEGESEEKPVENQEKPSNEDLNQIRPKKISLDKSNYSKEQTTNYSEPIEDQGNRPSKVDDNTLEQEREQIASRKYIMDKKYDQIYNKATRRGNRYKSKSQIEQQIRENMEKELKEAIPSYNEESPDKN